MEHGCGFIETNCILAWLLGCLAAWLLGCLAAWLLYVDKIVCLFGQGSVV
jgi:hypothetical protein